MRSPACAAVTNSARGVPAGATHRPNGSKQCEQLVALDAKLTKVLQGETQPADTGERLLMAPICQLPAKSLHAAAVRLYAAAFAEQPKAEADLQAQHRYNAACAAALAGTADAAKEPMTEAEKATLRRRAREWLQADLDVYAGHIKASKALASCLCKRG
jgi:hypothetical protein